MSSYGTIISGGKQMTKGLTKGINEKREEQQERHSRSQMIATAVRNAFTQRNLSDQSTNDVKGGKFKKVKQTSNV